MTSDDGIEENLEPMNKNHSSGSIVLRFVLPLLILVAGAFLVAWMLQTKPMAKPKPKVKSATIVEVQPVRFADRSTSVQAMGTVVPFREVELKAQVSGEIVEISPDFVPGGVLRAGQMLLKVDPANYELVLRQLRSEVQKAETELQLEQGNQLIARREFELLNQNVSEDEKRLMLRQPQLDNLKASLEANRARLNRAELDLERTQIHAPFNAVVRERQVNIGTRISEATPIATLVGTDEFWVMASVPANQLKWIQIPDSSSASGSKVKIFDPGAWGAKEYKEGHVVRLTAELEEQGRMARLLISVQDPLGLNERNEARQRLLIGSYVQVEISGKEVSGVVPVQRAHLRDGKTLWLMDDEGRLEIRTVQIVFKGQDEVLVASGLEAGEQVVVSDIPAPVAGMKLRTRDNTDQPQGKQTRTGPDNMEKKAGT